MVCGEYPPNCGGVGWYVYHLSRQLGEQDNDVVVITRNAMGGITKSNHPRVCVKPIVGPPIPVLDILIQKPEMQRVLHSMEDDLDVVHYHTPVIPYIHSSKPSVTTVHGTVEGSLEGDFDGVRRGFLPLLKALYVGQEKKILNYTDSIAAVSGGTRDWLRDSYGIARPIDVAYNGVDIQEFCRMKEIDGETDPCVLFVGALRPVKGVNILIDSLSIIAKNRKQVPKTLIVGTGPLESQIRERVRRIGYSNRVHVTGFVNREQLKLLYRQAAIYVLPSLHEGLPTTILEAMASSLPVIASDIPGPNEVVQNGLNGILFPPGDASSLAQSIVYLMDNPEVRRNLGGCGRKRTEERYSWPAITRKYFEMYHSIIR